MFPLHCVQTSKALPLDFLQTSKTLPLDFLLREWISFRFGRECLQCSAPPPGGSHPLFSETRFHSWNIEQVFWNPTRFRSWIFFLKPYQNSFLNYRAIFSKTVPEFILEIFNSNLQLSPMRVQHESSLSREVRWFHHMSYKCCLKSLSECHDINVMIWVCINQIVVKNLRIVAQWWSLSESYLLRLYFDVYISTFSGLKSTMAQ